MKNSIIGVICLCVAITTSTNVFSQSYKDSVEVQFLRYSDHLTNKKFDKSADYINPSFFKVIPRSQLVSMMEKVYNNPNVQFVIEKPSVLNIGDSKVIDGQHYLRFMYSNVLKMHFVQTGTGNPEITAITKSLENQFGADNVSYDASTGTYQIVSAKTVVANSKDKKKWTFVVVEEKQKPLLEKFIPRELL